MKSAYADEDLGRATKGAAQAMLMKANLHIKNFEEAEKWGAELIKQAEDDGEYALFPNYKDNFLLIGENGIESIFEIQYMEDGQSDFGEGFGFSRGTFTVILTRSRSSKLGGGWGFNRPSQDLYDAYESGDPRRDETILDQPLPEDPEEAPPADEAYLGNRYVNKKYGMYEDSPSGGLYNLTHASRGPINIKLIRYADALLMYAEACAETGNIVKAKWALEEVRNRARGGDASILPEFPNYSGYSDTKDDLVKAIRQERRVELAMEGHRWFDLCRWGVAKEVMDAYRASAPEEVSSRMNKFKEGVHEIFPIPFDEINLGGLTQNPGY